MLSANVIPTLREGGIVCSQWTGQQFEPIPTTADFLIRLPTGKELKVTGMVNAWERIRNKLRILRVSVDQPVDGLGKVFILRLNKKEEDAFPWACKESARSTKKIELFARVLRAGDTRCLTV